VILNESTQRYARAAVIFERIHAALCTRGVDFGTNPRSAIARAVLIFERIHAALCTRGVDL
jgi:hypothetical protein